MNANTVPAKQRSKMNTSVYEYKTYKALENFILNSTAISVFKLKFLSRKMEVKITLLTNKNEINLTKREIGKSRYFASHQWKYVKRDPGTRYTVNVLNFQN